ncbi:MFS transporter [Serinicoccus kebangsaanensis]|uniref:MFS transporter n=1 Tax=Serinicoccus kebangsaanensis TaxID=2602069 RepID=UPI00124EF078|nr:MFS transporter [Serinicoccus kebangsaanensis]
MTEAPPDGRRATGQLALVCVISVLALTTWFSATAAAPALRREWSIGPAAEALLTVGVQLGFVLGALASAATNLPDRVHPPRLIGIGAALAAAATTATATLADGPVTAVVLRVVTGVALALVYPVGMKVLVSWFAVRRGLAVSLMVGSLALGSIFPQLVSGALAQSWRPALLITAGLAAVASLLHPWLRVGPLLDRSEGFRPGVLVELWRQPAPRLANLGYLGHMWELYAVWAWAPAFLVASLAARGQEAQSATVGLVVFVAFGVCGLLGCVVAGWVGDRIGRARAAAAAMVVSGLCCLGAALAFGGPLWLLVPLLMVWGASVIADSAMFSACLGTVVDRRYVGTALTLQTALGFLLTMVTIQGLPLVAEATSWRLAVGLLAVGPLLGSLAMVRLHRLLPQDAAPAPAPRRPV